MMSSAASSTAWRAGSTSARARDHGLIVRDAKLAFANRDQQRGLELAFARAGNRHLRGGVLVVDGERFLQAGVTTLLNQRVGFRDLGDQER